MTNYNLMETRRVRLENEEEIKLEYYLINSTRCVDGEGKCIDGENLVGEETNLYGIKLVKEGSDYEEDEVTGVTLSEEVAVDLLKLLADNTVTPVSLVEVVDDWATATLYS